MIFFKIFTKYSTYHSLSANTGFKSLAFILFEILHLQNCDIKFQNFRGGGGGGGGGGRGEVWGSEWM